MRRRVVRGECGVLMCAIVCVWEGGGCRVCEMIDVCGRCVVGEGYVRKVWGVCRVWGVWM